MKSKEKEYTFNVVTTIFKDKAIVSPLIDLGQDTKESMAVREDQQQQQPCETRSVRKYMKNYNQIVEPGFQRRTNRKRLNLIKL